MITLPIRPFEAVTRIRLELSINLGIPDLDRMNSGPTDLGRGASSFKVNRAFSNLVGTLRASAAVVCALSHPATSDPATLCSEPLPP